MGETPVVSNFVVSYHVEVSRNFLNVESPSMPARGQGPSPVCSLDPNHLVFQFFIAIWTYWCLGRPRWTFTPVLYTGLLCKGCWDGGAPLSPPIRGRIHLFSFSGNLDFNQFKWY